MTPLHLAADSGHSLVVEVLIRSHADVNAVDKVSKCTHTYNNTAYRQIAIGHLHVYVCISSKNTFGIKKAWPSKVESYLEVNK